MPLLLGGKVPDPGSHFAEKLLGEPPHALVFRTAVPHRGQIRQYHGRQQRHADSEVSHPLPQRKLAGIDVDDVRVVAQDHAIDVAGELPLAAVPAAHVGAPLANGLKKTLSAAGLFRDGISAADAPQGVGIAAADARQALALKLHMPQQLGDEQVVDALHRPVLFLEHVEQLAHPLHVLLQSLAPLEVVEEVVQGEQNALRAQVPHKFAHVGAQLLNVAVLALGDVVNADVNLVLEIRQVGTDFLADDEIAGRPPVEQFQATVDGIVIGDGNQVHPALLGGAVDGQRRGVGIAAAEQAQVPGGARVIRMHMKVGSIHVARSPGQRE